MQPTHDYFCKVCKKLHYKTWSRYHRIDYASRVEAQKRGIELPWEMDCCQGCMNKYRALSNKLWDLQELLALSKKLEFAWSERAKCEKSKRRAI